MGLKEVVVGQDPLQVEALWDRMYDWTSYYGRRGVVIHAISAVDIALWDIRGKVLGKTGCGPAGRPQAQPVAGIWHRLSAGRDRLTKCAATSTAG